jgi:hypothetical protein
MPRHLLGGCHLALLKPVWPVGYHGTTRDLPPMPATYLRTAASGEVRRARAACKFEAGRTREDSIPCLSRRNIRSLGGDSFGCGQRSEGAAGGDDVSACDHDFLPRFLALLAGINWTRPHCFHSLPPPTLGECGHRSLARRLIAVRRVRSSWCPKASVHIHGSPTGAALALKMRPTTSPLQSTSKSSSLHSPDGRLSAARFRSR